ncbi:YbbR-like domain-containing protein [Listeria cossartiae subsp. cayugensis]|uniref:YbbR-like domain-containing protein n=1 Tax=Listeria cossartiae subsp. cayugensis TaxID=2713505 RepID=A0ABU2INN7_9LIST|nr:YbbR-like domain-containing protein [Listeria cossartiae]MDT0049807.1 YbbR-like domain-containing protein [Listeria cossartiae subsp. cayugensis]MDT0066310.1 YbbR-like domain-containing protein [Listeria cossartiae subsp. cayugensis]MDT0080199.1 YbbR-like domain-containing protein [Listeria cossartiae subsp. cayugensis]MDT0083506.1 YbbR-like domain-containing protein [Listeria cossartiae subsp. cayugensis]MDT0088402.1 YbbR-like domain-containing protein [Listeria cossartiae subsp. cayugensi
MDRILNNKWSIRIIALILAAILFTSVNANNNNATSFSTTASSDSEVIENVPVKVYYDKTNLYISGIPETVTVTLSGPRSIVQSAKAQQDFTVYADLKNASIGTQEVKLQVKDVSDRLKVKVNPATVTVNVQEKVTKKFSVDVELSKSVIADGYQAGTPIIDPKKVSITGAKDTIEQIAYVKATLENDGKHKSEFTDKATVSVFDSNLNKLDVEVNPQEVEVTVPVEKVGKSVPVKIKQEGTPENDIEISSMTPDKSEVVVVGDDAVLEKIKEIEIPIDVSKIKADTVKEVTVPVPNGAKSVQPTTIEVKIKTVKKSEANNNTTSDNNQGTDTSDENTDDNSTKISKSFSSMQVYMSGLKNTFDAQMITPANGKVSVTITGEKKTVDGIAAKDLSVIANLSKSKAGNYSIPLELNGLPDNVAYVINPRRADFIITDKEASIQVPSKKT